MPKHPQKMKIVIMDDHFLYLPLFYAQSENFFGHIPEGYNIEITTSSDHTDELTFKMLMDTNSAKNADINFAVADPTIILSHQASYEATPAILAAMISNTAFWAVDRKSHIVIEPQDLAAFQNIIAFHPGTTSYSIARRIFKDAKKPPSILPVHPNQELIALLRNTNTVALSPDILGIDALLHEKDQFNIDLVLGTTQEFQNVFMTGLISRQDVVAQHRSMIIGLLKALQFSLMQVRAQAPELLAFSEHRFPHPKERIESALHRAAKAHVFPLTIEVSPVTWMNAAKIYYESTSVGFGQLEQQKARSVFQHVVQPYLALSSEAVNDLYSQVTAPSKTESQWLKALRISLIVILCLGVGICLQQWFDWKAITVVILCTLTAIALEVWLKLKRNSVTWFYHWFYCIAFQLVLLMWVTPAIRSNLPLTTYLPFPIAAAILFQEMKLVHDERKKLGDGGN